MSDEGLTPAGSGHAGLSVFICYRRSDSRADAGRLYEALSRRFGRHKLFMDVDSLRPGQDWSAAVEDAIARSDVVLALIGPRWVDAVDATGVRRLDDPTDHVRREIETALELDKPVIPIVFETARMPASGELPESLRGLSRRHAIRIAHSTYRTDFSALTRALRSFEPAAAAPTRHRRAPAAVAEARAPEAPDEVVEPTTAYRGFLFSDLRGYTRFVERRGDAAGAELLDRYRGIVRRTIGRYDGAEVKTEGDSFYVVFPSASAAVLCGLAITDEAATASRADPSRPISPGVGVHAGETVERPEGFVGSAVNLAARVCATAEPGEVLVTDTVRTLTRTNLAVRFVPRGRRHMKGIAEPVTLYRAEGASAVAPVVVRRTSRVAVGAIGALATVAAVLGVIFVGAKLIGPNATESAPGASSTAPASSNAASGSPGASVVVPPTGAPGPGLIAYVLRDNDDRASLMLVNPDTGVQTELVPATADSSVTSAGWAFDGQHIAWALFNAGPQTSAIWVARPDGSDARELAITGGVDDFVGIYWMAWAPAGDRIVFGANNGLSIVNVGDGTVSSLTSDPALMDRAPAWSPDGARIAFVRAPNDEIAPPEAARIWTIAADGTGAAPLRSSSNGDEEDNPAWSPDGTRVAFDMSATAGRDIYVTSAVGTSLTRLTEHPAEDWAPSWSPDGTRIAFTSLRDRQPAIYVMTADGSDQRLLAAAGDNLGADQAHWGAAATIASGRTPTPPTSPSAAPTIATSSLAGLGRLALLEWQPDVGQRVVLMDPDGSNRENLLLPIDPELDSIVDLEWTRDGTRLAINVLGSDETGEIGYIWVVNADGTSPRQLVSDGFVGMTWSPDGARIAYTRPITGGETWRSGIAVVDVATGATTSLPLEAGATAREPSWSPDGSTIVFVKEIDAEDQQAPPALWLMRPDGSDARLLLSLPPFDQSAAYIRQPAWSPDGARIAFVGSDNSPDDDSNIYVTNTQGTTLAQLTSAVGSNSEPTWSPDSRFIAFSSNRDFQNVVFVMAADGSSQTPLTSAGVGSGLPAWGP